jgi:hypothetical protein
MTFPSESTARQITLANAAESPWSSSTSALIETSVRECINMGRGCIDKNKNNKKSQKLKFEVGII